MKQKLVYAVFGTALLLININLLLVNIKTYASGVRYISFASNRTGNYDIYLMDIHGENLRNLTNHPANEFSPTWSPDGQFLAYASNREGNYEIYVMNIKTQQHRQLTNDPGNDISPAWSPDGRWIAFSSERAGGRRPNYDIYRMDVNGKKLQRLTNQTYNRYAAWSPDSQWIAFYSIDWQNLKGAIYLMTADGRKLRHLTKASTGGATWAPDGKQIAFPLLQDRRSINIVVLNTEGGEHRNLTDREAFEKVDRSPVWSPDGEWIIFVSHRLDPAGQLGLGDISVINATGGEPRQLTTHPSNDTNPAWVPETFFSVSPSAEKMTTLWSRLKQP